ncbi:MAG: tail fiber domain-containing protein [Bacteroidia bacterium]|nr:tail fiber domain-containing protein [Bacteroidia bacterium]
MKQLLIKSTLLVASFLLLTNGAFAQNVGIGIATPAMKLHVEGNAATDGIIVNNNAANGDPVVQFRLNNATAFTMGVDDSNADKFMIGHATINTNTRITIESGGNIGIRTTAPGNMLHMTNGGAAVGATSMANFENADAAGVALASRNSSTASGYNGFEGITDYNGTTYIPAGVFGLAIYNGPANAATIGVRGASNEWQGTGVRGSRYNGGGANTGWGGEFYDDLGYTGFLGTISDARTKKNIQPMQAALSMITQLRPVTYNYDTEKYPYLGLSTTEEFGFIAQEVQQVLPTVTRTKTLDTEACKEAGPNQIHQNKNQEFLVMDYVRLVPILTQGIKEQQVQIQELQQKADQAEALQTEVNQLRSELEELRKVVDKLSAGN